MLISLVRAGIYHRLRPTSREAAHRPARPPPTAALRYSPAEAPQARHDPLARRRARRHPPRAHSGCTPGARRARHAAGVRVQGTDRNPIRVRPPSPAPPQSRLGPGRKALAAWRILWPVCTLIPHCSCRARPGPAASGLLTGSLSQTLPYGPCQAVWPISSLRTCTGPGLGRVAPNHAAARLVTAL